MSNSTLYQKRFPVEKQRNRHAMWNAIVACELGKFIKRTDTVLDIGAGHCEFLKAITCRKKLAIDINPDIKRFISPSISVISRDVRLVPSSYRGTIDVVIMSHILEHLRSKDEVRSMIGKSYHFLKPGGIAMIMSPNIDLVHEKYWDFIDHCVPLNGPSLIEAAKEAGFFVLQFQKRFLPYTTVSRFPIRSFLIALYLRMPEVFRPFAGQSLLIIQKKDRVTNI